MATIIVKVKNTFIDDPYRITEVKIHNLERRYHISAKNNNYKTKNEIP